MKRNFLFLLTLLLMLVQSGFAQNDNITIECDQPYILRNIIFALNSDKLFDSSYPELDRLAGKMEQSTSMKIVVIGHTDNLNSSKHSLILSRKRTEVIKAYLVSKGINESRILTLAKGDQSPIANNDTREGRSLNNRIEIGEKK